MTNDKKKKKKVTAGMVNGHEFGQRYSRNLRGGRYNGNIYGGPWRETIGAN